MAFIPGQVVIVTPTEFEIDLGIPVETMEYDALDVVTSYGRQCCLVRDIGANPTDPRRLIFEDQLSLPVP